MTAIEDKLRRATDRIAQLDEEKTLRGKQEEQRTQRIQSTEKNMREICEKILAKAASEMRLGEAYAWANIDIDTLLKKTKEAYLENEKAQKDMTLRLLNRIDELNGANQALTAQIIRIKQNPTDIPENAADVRKRAAEEKKKQKKTPEPQNETGGNAGPVDVIAEDENDPLYGVENDLMNEAAKTGADMQPLTKHSVPTKRSKKTKKAVSEASKKAKAQVAVVSLSDYEKNITEAGWAIIQVIGEQGLSRYTDIEPEVIKMNKSWTTSHVRLQQQALVASNILNAETISTALRPRHQILKLSKDIGEALYETKFGKPPVESEWAKIAKEHANPTHGYHIKELYDLLYATDIYKSVEMFHRKGRTFDAGNNNISIPDITFKDKADTTYYIEYELGTTPTTDFNAKCSKLANVTSTINIVTPNKEIAEKLKRQVDKWVSNRGVKALAGIKVRISGVKGLKAPTPSKGTVDLRKDENWQIVYDLSNSAEPIYYY